MAYFLDDFERNGQPLGANWSMTQGALGIAYGGCQGAPSGGARTVPQFASLSQQVEWVHAQGGAYSGRSEIKIRYTYSAGDAYYGRVTPGPSTFLLAFGMQFGGTYTEFGSIALTGNFASLNPFVLRYSAGVLEMLSAGNVVLSQITDVVPAGYGAEIWCTSTDTFIGSFEMMDMPSGELVATPDPITTPGLPQEIAISGGLGNWSPGIPGVPTFSVDVGTVLSQRVLSNDAAVIEWEGPPTSATVTVTDSVNDQSATFEASSLMQAGSGGGASGDLTTVLAYLADMNALWLGGGDPPPSIMSEWLGKVVDWFALYAPSTEGGAHELAAIIETLGTSSADPETLRYVIELIRQIVAANATRLDAMTGEGAYDLADVAITVQGAGSKTIADVVDAIGGVRGVNNVDLTGIFSSLYDLRTANGYTLADVSTWISNLSEPDLSAVLAAISGVSDDVAAVKAVVDGIGAYDDAAVLAAIAALALALAATEAATVGAVGTVGAAVTAGAVENTAGWLAAAAGFVDVLAAIGGIASTLSNLSVDLQPVIDDIADLATATDARFDSIDSDLAAISEQIALVASRIQARMPIIYPGSSQVDWGEPVEINATGVVNGPLDGVRVELNYVPPDVGHQAVPGHDRYMYLGALVFSLADGDLDERQQINWDQAIYVPKATSLPDNVVVRCRPGVTLTVTPWTLAVA